MLMNNALIRPPLASPQARIGKEDPTAIGVRNDAALDVSPSQRLVQSPVQHHIIYPDTNFRDSRLAPVLGWGAAFGVLGAGLGALVRPNQELKMLGNVLTGAGWGLLAGGAIGGLLGIFQPRAEILAKRRYERENDVKLIPSAIASGYEAIPVITVPGISSSVVQTNGQIYPNSGAPMAGINGLNTPVIIANQPYDLGYYGYQNHYGIGEALGSALLFSTVANTLTPNTYRGYSDNSIHHHHYNDRSPRSVPRYSKGANGVGVGASTLRPSGSGASYRSRNSGFGSSSRSKST
jgi:hypothetical protein